MLETTFGMGDKKNLVSNGSDILDINLGMQGMH